MKRTLIAAFAACVAAAAQPIDAEELVARVKDGDADEVLAALPALKKEAPGDEGIVFVDAMLAKNAEEALYKFQAYLSANPFGEYADEAILRIHDYYYAVGSYKTAEDYANRLREEHPHSPLLARLSREGDSDVEDLVPLGDPATPADDPPRETPPSDDPTTTSAEETASYTVVAGRFEHSLDAMQLKDGLIEVGYDARIAVEKVGGEIVFVVKAGSFSSKTDADVVAKAIADEFTTECEVERTR